MNKVKTRKSTLMVRSGTRGRILDVVFASATKASAIFVLLIIVAIMLSLLIGAWPALKRFGFYFVISKEWNPVTEHFGALVAIYGTIVTSIIAMLIGVPVSFGIAVFITELCPAWLKQPIATAIELLAAIPSIIYGMWGLFVFAPFFGDHVEPWLSNTLGRLPVIGPLFSGPPLGIGVLTAGIILGIMIIPFMASVFRDLFEVVPPVLKESAYGIGATTWEVIKKIVLPYTKIGVVGAIMLGLGRALGETMAVTFVIGNADRLETSLLMPGNTISSSLANQFTEAVGKLYTSSLIALGLLLFILTFIVLFVAKYLLVRLTLKEGVRT